MAEARTGGEPVGWPCAACTFVNMDVRRRTCAACRTRRAAPPPTKGTKRRADAPPNTCGGYAARLSDYRHKGVTGLPETEDAPDVLDEKMRELIALVRAARSVVVMTGAGVSTSAGLPDFRGPAGIWTLEDEARKKRKKARPVDLAGISGASFETCVPTLTHRALVALEKHGTLDFLATQNVDGLHRRSGFERSKLGVLHGCVFTERCEVCGHEAFHDTDLGGVSFQPTGNTCETCRGTMRDTVLDWDDSLPSAEWGPAEAAFGKADLCLALGTSLRIIPAADMPALADKFVIVNLQETPKDGEAALVIRAKVDGVMARLCGALGVLIEPAAAAGTQGAPRPPFVAPPARQSYKARSPTAAPPDAAS
jgi:mono-ADP-ribosyltransferase sirtuin 6